MRRLLLLAMVAVMMATMLVVTADPASATIHSISCGDNTEKNPVSANNPVEEEQNPPGISDDDEDAVVDNGPNAEERQPVTSVRDNDGSAGPNDEAEDNAIRKKAGRCAD